MGVEPAEDDIPKVFITGVKPTTKDDVLAEMEYISKTDKFHAYLEIKCQGSSSMSFAKKNFTVKLYSDEARETKQKKSFKNWNHESNKFVLKANWIDHSHARNIVCARLWGEVVESRPDYSSLPVEMRNAPNNGAIDGFPVKVYYNGTYEGLYTWNIGKDDWMWGMDEDNTNHVLLCAETNDNGNKSSTPCNFRALWSGVHGSNWSVEVGTNSDAVKTSLNNLIQFVMDNDGEAFRNGIGNYLDVQSAIDYYVFMYDICSIDCLARNMLLATYDGTKWICGAYDLDSTFGSNVSGGMTIPANYACPEQYQETNSLLWERFEANFTNELKARQAELRKTVLSYSNIVTHFERFMDAIGLDLYAEDLTIYTGIPSGSNNNIKQIRNFIRDRHAYVDGEFATMVNIPCTGISLSAETLTFTADVTQTLIATVTPEGCTDAITWESDNTRVATVNNGVVRALANGNATIIVKCGEYSASCVVTVSGVAEIIACTGISLDKTELTFNGKGSQTLTATTTPSDTTDVITWESSNTSIAVVENGMVTAKQNGTVIITAKCGEHVATCNVNVSGIEMNMLEGAEWTTGYYASSNGVLTAADSEAVTSMIDVSAYVGRSFIGNNTGKYSRVVFYDESEGFVKAFEANGVIITIPENAKYMRFSLSQYKQAHNPLVLLELDNNLFDTSGVVDGNPENAGDSGSRMFKMDVTSGDIYYIIGGWGLWFLGEDGETLEKYSQANANQYILSQEYTAPSGAVSMAIAGIKADMNAGRVKIATSWEKVGCLTLPI